MFDDFIDKVSEIAGVLFFYSVILGFLWGWILNIIQLFNDNMTVGMAVLKGIGVILAPLGAILGFIGT